MRKRTIKNAGGQEGVEAPGRSGQQKGAQQGHNTGKDAWKSNQKHVDGQPGPGQKGQRPRRGETWGTTPGEVRGNPGGKRGQAMSGQRGTAKSMKTQPKRGRKKGSE